MVRYVKKLDGQIVLEQWHGGASGAWIKVPTFLELTEQQKQEAERAQAKKPFFKRLFGL